MEKRHSNIVASVESYAAKFDIVIMTIDARISC